MQKLLQYYMTIHLQPKLADMWVNFVKNFTLVTNHRVA
jgi:hypothetical protein